MVDASDETNALVSKMEFLNMTNHAELQDVPILVLANKSDLPTAQSVPEISVSFALTEIKT